MSKIGFSKYFMKKIRFETIIEFYGLITKKNKFHFVMIKNFFYRKKSLEIFSVSILWQHLATIMEQKRAV